MVLLYLLILKLFLSLSSSALLLLVVVPGIIIYYYNEKSNTFNARLKSHRHANLSRGQSVARLISDRNQDVHVMKLKTKLQGIQGFILSYVSKLLTQRYFHLS